MTYPTQAILFDLDGTLLDTAPDFCHCLNEMLRTMQSPPLALDMMRSWISGGAKEMICQTFKIDEKHPDFSNLRQDFLSKYSDLLGQFTQPFPGITVLLQALNDASLPWGIITNKPKRYTLPLLEKFDFLAKAQCVVCGDTLSTAKPDPAPIHHACEIMQLNPKACYYIGDALSDAQASTRAGMPCILAHYGYVPPKTDFSLWPVYKIIQHPNEILSFIRT